MAAVANGDCIFDSKLAVGEGIKIEQSVRIEVVETNRDLISSAKFCISSYQLPARTSTLYEGDVPFTYTTYSGTKLSLEVTTISVDSVHFKVTGPTNWRVTGYYSVDPAEDEAETEAETATTGAPELEITRSFDRTAVSAGQMVEVTFMIKNTGDGAATDVRLDESTITGTYKENCKSTLEDMAAGETRRVSYDIMVTGDAEPGTYELSSAILNYKGESGDSYSTESTSNTLEIIPETVQVPELEVSIEFSEPIESADGVVACGDRFLVTVRIANVGNATTGRVNVKSDLPDDVRVVSGESEPVFDSIEPGESEEYEITLIAYEPGKHAIDVVVMWTDSKTDASLDFWAEESGLKEYYLQIMVAVPMALALLGIIKRHRAYSY